MTFNWDLYCAAGRSNFHLPSSARSADVRLRTVLPSFGSLRRAVALFFAFPCETPVVRINMKTQRGSSRGSERGKRVVIIQLVILSDII